MPVIPGFKTYVWWTKKKKVDFTSNKLHMSYISNVKDCNVGEEPIRGYECNPFEGYPVNRCANILLCKNANNFTEIEKKMLFLSFNHSLFCGGQHILRTRLPVDRSIILAIISSDWSRHEPPIRVFQN